MLLLGLFGLAGAAWGYGLFLLATALLLSGAVLLALYCMTSAFDGDTLRHAFWAAFVAGGSCYVLAVAALAGFYTHETFAGRLELKWIVFGPVVLAAIIALDMGLYRIIYERNRPTIERYSHVLSRDNMDPRAMRSTFIDEVLLHKTLLSISPFRWIRHQLILWGFGLMFAIELLAVVFREAWPAFGFTDIWHTPGNPLRAAFDFAYDVTGLMVLAGCVLALVYRAMVNGKPDQKYTDTPTATFLLAVVVTGFVLEGIRIALAGPAAAHAGTEFAGYAFAGLASALGLASPVAYGTMWYTHVLLVCAFIAYVPARRLVHSCATPIGRLVNSQKAMLALKKERSLTGLLRRQSFVAPVPTSNPHPEA